MAIDRRRKSKADASAAPWQLGSDAGRRHRYDIDQAASRGVFVTVQAPMSSAPSRLARIRAAVPQDLLIVRLFAITLAFILIGYMAMGRGFAHIGVGPVFIGDVVLILGVITGIIALARRRFEARPSATVVLLLAFMALGVLRTIPYLGTYGINALRDGVLWGYAIFALLICGLMNRAWIEAAVRLYSRVVPLFALWLPICWIIFVQLQQGIDPSRPGSNHPLVFFKAGDMAVHATAAIAFIVLAPSSILTIRAFVARLLASAPLTWTLLLAGAASRGALVATASGLGVAALATRRPSNWLPVAAAALVVVLSLNASAIIGGTVTPSPSPPPSPSSSPSPLATGSQSPSESPLPSPSASSSPSMVPTQAPTQEPGRQPTARQWIVNILSIFGSSSESGLDGTKAFRLAWWTKIADYTIFGPYFWNGKGFGVNLADDDGFQPTADHSLRAPHNSHMTVLARMGVPGLVLWVLLQGAFFFGMLRAVWVHRREGDLLLAGLGAWVLVIWIAMMINTSFDPYLEGPQGGIWYWSAFGLGLVVMRLVPKRAPR